MSRLSFALSFLILLSSCNWKDPKGSVVVMSLNARYDNLADAPHDWESRKPVIVATILGKSADIIGFQELLRHQVDDMDSLLPWYDYLGVGREDGKNNGEFVPVFYKMNRFEVIDHGTFWLSETPSDTGGVGWDAALPRISTWVKFRDLHLQREGNFFEFYFLNTHFDHMGDTARKESARLLRDFVRQSMEGMDVIITGDFNCDPSQEPYALITSEIDGISGLQDACGPTLTGEAVDLPTFNGFGNVTDSRRIDYIFMNENWDIFSYETLTIRQDNIYISDHYPVIARVKVRSF